MIEAQLLIVTDDDNGYSVFGPWMPKQADNIEIILDYVASSAVAPEMIIDLFTKDSEDTGNGTAVTGFSSLTASSVDRHQAQAKGGLGELVRYKYTVKKNSTGGSAGDWVLFRMLSPIWYDTVIA